MMVTNGDSLISTSSLVWMTMSI